MDLQQLARQAGEAVRQAGALARSIPRPQVHTKEGHANFVTDADLAAQRFLLERLSPLLPGAHFFAEEQQGNQLAPGYNWIIDPIDGTANFIRRYPPSAVSVGLVRDGEAVLGLVLDLWQDQLYSAVKGGGAFLEGERLQAAHTPVEDSLVVFGTAPYYRDKAALTFAMAQEVFLRCGDLRRSGSAALDLCHVAAGRCDGFFEAYLSPWDYAAGAVLLTEAGAQVGTAPGEPFRFDRGQAILAGGAEVYPLLEEIAGKYLPQYA